MIFTIITSLVLRIVWARENTRRDQASSVCPASGPHKSAAGEEKEGEIAGPRGSRVNVLDSAVPADRDLTDWEDQSFRYSL